MSISTRDEIVRVEGSSRSKFELSVHFTPGSGKDTTSTVSSARHSVLTNWFSTQHSGFSFTNCLPLTRLFWYLKHPKVQRTAFKTTKSYSNLEMTTHTFPANNSSWNPSLWQNLPNVISAIQLFGDRGLSGNAIICIAFHALSVHA